MVQPQRLSAMGSPTKSVKPARSPNTSLHSDASTLSADEVLPESPEAEIPCNGKGDAADQSKVGMIRQRVDDIM